jgi:hypothetical protein
MRYAILVKDINRMSDLYRQSMPRGVELRRLQCILQRALWMVLEKDPLQTGRIVVFFGLCSSVWIVGHDSSNKPHDTLTAAHPFQISQLQFQNLTVSRHI